MTQLSAMKLKEPTPHKRAGCSNKHGHSHKKSATNFPKQIPDPNIVCTIAESWNRLYVKVELTARQSGIHCKSKWNPLQISAKFAES